MSREPRTRTITRLLSAAFVLTLGVAGAVGLASSIQAQESEAEENAGMLAARGRVTFRIYCENCHGPNAEGDGTIADWLTVPPANLTTLTANNDGEFPAERLMAVVDGRRSVAGHSRKGGREMPIWGEIFRDPMSLSATNENETPEERAERKIKELVAYLRTLQPVE